MRTASRSAPRCSRWRSRMTRFPVVNNRSIPRILLLAATACAVTAPNVLAQVTRIEIVSREPANKGAPFGSAGPYEIIRGRIYGEVDPKDRHNRIIQDIDLAPRNARGRVEYVATFAVARPVDAARASGVLIYQVGNRGNGDVTPNADGDISVGGGWQGT